MTATTSHHDRRLDARTVNIIIWDDDHLASTPGSVTTDSLDAELYWLPMLGPTATLLARRLIQLSTAGYTTINTDELAKSLGVGTTQLDRALDRLERFRVIARYQDNIAIRRQLPPITNQRARRYLTDDLTTGYFDGRTGLHALTGSAHI